MKFKKGFSLIEILLALAIVVGLSLGIYAVYTKVSVERNTLREAEHIHVIIAAANSLVKTYGWNIMSNANLTTIMINSGLVSDDMISRNKKSIINSFGGTISLEKGTKKYRIVYNKVPQRECVNLVEKVYYSLYGYLVINNSGTSSSSYNDGSRKWKLDLGRLTETCAGRGTTSQKYNQIIFDFDN